ncbi:hypothetical protein Vadar_001013 [Vaccinium darrowii]|uniref:Uncharacterized protein n=1 Tax=Vaccinium darrowii TaxID=229202 RepID=A0ACB7XM93_9ERIC|nr:hypothetical protein Vadar_001013 [Vaccinium darrowii]
MHPSFNMYLHVLLFLSWLLLPQPTLVISTYTTTIAAAVAAITNKTFFIAKPGCNLTCGSLTVPYPFGIGVGSGCSIDPGFDINCSHSSDTPKAIISTWNVEVLSISQTQVRIRNNIAYACYNESGALTESLLPWTNLGDPGAYPYTFSEVANKFTVVGCDDYGWILANNLSSGYIDECANPDLNDCDTENGKCINTPGSFSCSCNPHYDGDGKSSPDGKGCKESQFPVIQFALGVGGIFIGVLVLIGFCFWLYCHLKRQKKIRVKQKFFERNGGLLFQQQISSSEGSVMKTKLFMAKELEKATDNFNQSRVLGKGGVGTVYKGMLQDGSIVAVKKSNITTRDQLKEAIKKEQPVDAKVAETIAKRKEELDQVDSSAYQAGQNKTAKYYATGQVKEITNDI